MTAYDDKYLNKQIQKLVYAYSVRRVLQALADYMVSHARDLATDGIGDWSDRYLKAASQTEQVKKTLDR